MADPLGYTTWGAVAEIVKGEKRLLDILAGSGDTAEDHPYFDGRLLEAERRVNVALEKAGYAVPLDVEDDVGVADPDLRRAVTAIMVDLVTETSSSREPWHEKFGATGREYLEQIKAGDTLVLAAEPEPSSTSNVHRVTSTFVDEPQFDLGDPHATVHDIFPPLGGTGGRWQ